MVNHPHRAAGRKTKAPAAAIAAAAKRHSASDDHDYSGLLHAVPAAFAEAILRGTPLFQTDAHGLNDVYLGSIPGEQRQQHDCTACRRFIDAYGGLVQVEPDGSTVSVMWDPRIAPDLYKEAFGHMRDRAQAAKIVAPFLAKEPILGSPVTGTWRHMAVPNPSPYRGRVLTPGQAMAAAKENFRTVAAALTELKAPALDEALRILRAGALARSEKFIGPVEWLRALHDRPKGRAGANLMWLAIAMAPEGFCHPKSSVVGPLLQDIVDGLPFDEIRARFNAKMAPLRYQRPQAAPSAGTIQQAEKLVETLGIARSLERRFARLDECEKLWVPPTQVEGPAPEGGVFGHLQAKGRGPVKRAALPAQTMTWAKFSATVLPTAERLEMLAPSSGSFIALVTAAHADAPPILKWDAEQRRNPVSGYVYHPNSTAAQWNLRAGAWTTVAALVPQPHLWHDGGVQLGLPTGLVLVLEGARDTRTGQGNALFPETLKAELHGVRSVIEAYSRKAVLGGAEEASACGYAIGQGGANVVLRVDGSEYRIDRWD